MFYKIEKEERVCVWRGEGRRLWGKAAAKSDGKGDSFRKKMWSYWLHPEELFIFISCSALPRSRFLPVLPPGEH